MARRVASSLLASAILLTGCSGNESSTAPNGGHRPLPAPSVSVSRPPIPAAVHMDAVLPTVTGAVGRRADITLPKAKPSGRFVINTLMKGRGRTAGKNDVVVVHYTAKSWHADKVEIDLPPPGGLGNHLFHQRREGALDRPPLEAGVMRSRIVG